MVQRFTIPYYTSYQPASNSRLIPYIKPGNDNKLLLVVRCLGRSSNHFKIELSPKQIEQFTYFTIKSEYF